MSIEKTPEHVRYARGSAGQDPHAGLARQLVELAREMQADQTMPALVQRIVEAAVREIEPARYAGITLARKSAVHSEAATDDVVTRLDEAQRKLGQGPCLSALREEATVRSDDLPREERWPDFVAAALAEGVRSMLSVQLFVEDDNIGALNLYATEPQVFDDDSESAAMLLAAHAAIAIKGSADESNLRAALETRDLIGQAKGILMERYKLSPLQAFHMLVTASQRTNRKLREVADELATTGEMRTGNPAEEGSPPA